MNLPKTFINTRNPDCHPAKIGETPQRPLGLNLLSLPVLIHLNVNLRILTEAPWWFLLFCLLAALIYAIILYRRDRDFRDVMPWIRWLMASLRFLTIFFLCFLLMSPLIKTESREIEKPLIVVLQDESASVGSIRDSVAFKSNYLRQMNDMLESLGEDFDIRTYSVGASLKQDMAFQFEDTETDLSTPVSTLRARYAGRNIGAVILASDGLFNRGANPLYSYPDLKAPVYTIGLGDTTVFRDLIIREVRHNRTAYRGNTFPVEITVDARKCSGESFRLSVSRNDKVLFTRNLQISGNRFNTIVPVYLDASESGLLRYRVSVTKLSGELTYANNEADFVVEVIENKQVVLCLSAAPHPDISTIRNILESNPGYEFRTMNIAEFKGDYRDINLLILHQVITPPVKTNESLQNEIPVWYILGSQTSVATFNSLKSGVEITDNRSNTAEIQADPDRNFSLFTFDEEHLRRISGFPPLVSPFGNYLKRGEVQTLFNQKIGAIRTTMPLMYFNVAGNRKMAVTTGEGLWKWRLSEFSAFGNHEAANAFVMKTIQYLSAPEIRTPFRLYYKKSFSENEPVVFNAELYNETGELLNTPEVQITITDEEGRSYPYAFNRTERAYNLNAGYLPAGIYNFSAKTFHSGKTITRPGMFTVKGLFAEKTETVADHSLLQAIASKTGGQFYPYRDMSALANEIRSRNDIRPVSYMQKKLDDMINLKWIFILLTLLLSAEWFLRKRNGAY